MNKLKIKLIDEFLELKILLQSVPSLVMALFVTSVILMNLLANKEMGLNIPWLALDCGITVSWLSFLCMDMLTKRFGAKASFQLSLVACGVNLLVCGILFLISKIPGNWGAYYTFNSEIVNASLNSTVGGTWYVLMGSTIAFILSSGVNSVINASIGKMYKKDNFKGYALRSYISTLVGQFVDNLTFALIVSHTFFGWSMIQCITCSLTGCVVELLCEVVFSPIGYKVCNNWDTLNVGRLYLDYLKVNGAE